ncbi:hypothetical protein F5148DRAFT_1158298 [Russula earlei]|uniref:Uncharacterized protein n=1 Tax=Russula earlei TaxID=71964 RepID=A0ACC0UPN6_9AGAM|nr:hypothetical protein F5148DRAFT_1158298 [Russula earlei]
MQSSVFQAINALLQQFQQPPCSPSTLPPPSVNTFEAQLMQSIQATNQNTLHQAGLSAFLQSLQQQSPQPTSTHTSAQLLFDALKMIAPVGESPNDEQLLVFALHSGLSKGLDHRRAIETLHGVNNHAANLWKDYYLEHKSHIDEMVNQLQPIKTAKKPVRFDPEPGSLSAFSKIEGKQPNARSANERNISAPLESRSSRKKIVPPTPGMRGQRGLSRHSDRPLPPPPEVEPVPPTTIVKTVRGNQYTIEDKKYFAKYISWALHTNSSLTKSELIVKLAENVPHHTANSWASYWTRDPLADRLLAAAVERATENDQDHGYTRDAGEEEDYIENNQESIDEVSSHDSEEDIAAMGERGGAFTAAESRVMAKYIARHDPDEWAMMTGKQRWLPFHEEHPNRSDKAYGERYRVEEQKLLRLAERYRRRAHMQLEKQCGTPSWANAGVRKRRASFHEWPGKRARE